MTHILGVRDSERATTRGEFSGGRRRQRGAAMVEAALILPLVLMLFMRIVDFSLAIADYNSLRQGTREGVRRAVVGDVGTDALCPTGAGAPTIDTASLVCLTKARTGLDAANTRVAVGFDPSYAEGDAMILCTQYSLSSTTGFFGFLLNGRVVHSQVHMRVEKATLDLQSFQEPGGDSWAWCGQLVVYTIAFLTKRARCWSFLPSLWSCCWALRPSLSTS